MNAKLVSIMLSVLLALVIIPLSSAKVYVSDQFNRANSDTIGGAFTKTKEPVNTNISITSNKLRLTDSSAVGGAEVHAFTHNTTLNSSTVVNFNLLFSATTSYSYCALTTTTQTVIAGSWNNLYTVVTNGAINSTSLAHYTGTAYEILSLLEANKGYNVTFSSFDTVADTFTATINGTVKTGLPYSAGATGGNDTAYFQCGHNDGGTGYYIELDDFCVYDAGTECFPVAAAPVISLINFTSDAPPEYTCSYPTNCANTTDTTPSFELATDINAVCRIDGNDTAYGSMTADCTQNGAYNTSHSCTYPSVLSPNNYTFYFACNSSVGNSNTVPLANAHKALLNITNTAPNISNINVTLINITAGLQWFNLTWQVSDLEGNSTISSCWVDHSGGRSRANFTSSNQNCSIVFNLTFDGSSRTFTPLVNDSQDSIVLGTNYTGLVSSLNRYIINSSQVNNVTAQFLIQQWNISNSIAASWNVQYARNSTDFIRNITIVSSGIYGDNLTHQGIDIIEENASFNLNALTNVQLLINGSSDEPVNNVTRGFVLNNTLGVPVDSFSLRLIMPLVVNQSNVRVANGSGLTQYTDVSFILTGENASWDTPILQTTTNWTYLGMWNAELASVANHTQAIAIAVGSNTRYFYGSIITSNYNLSDLRLTYCFNSTNFLPSWSGRFDLNSSLYRYPSSVRDLSVVDNTTNLLVCGNWTASESQYGFSIKYDVAGVVPGIGGGGGGGGGGGESLVVVIGNFSTDFMAVDAYHLVFKTPSNWSYTLTPNRVPIVCTATNTFNCLIDGGKVTISKLFGKPQSFSSTMESEVIVLDKDSNQVKIPVRVRLIYLGYSVDSGIVSKLPVNELLFTTTDGVNTGVRLWWIVTGIVVLLLVYPSHALLRRFI